MTPHASDVKYVGYKCLAVCRNLAASKVARQERLIKVVFERLGADGPTAAARALGWTEFSAPRNLARWLSESHEPKLGEVMDMLAGAGLLQPEALEAWSEVSLEEARRRVEARRSSAAERVDAASREAGAAARARLEEPAGKSKRRRGSA